jgi:hypothetical protein
MVSEQGGDQVAHFLEVDRGPGLTAEGRAQAVCGRVFLPAPLAAPLGRPCPLCEAVLQLVHARA